MNFLDLCSARYSVRSFNPEPVGEEDLNYIIECGRVAPTACNNQPQRILVLNTDEDREKLRATPASQNHAPTALLVCCDRDRAWRRRSDGQSSLQVDAAIVQTHMMLAAAERGVGSVWVMAFDPEETRRIFSVPENLEPVSFLMLGYPAEDAAPSPMHTAKLQTEEIVFHSRFS